MESSRMKSCCLLNFNTRILWGCWVTAQRGMKSSLSMNTWLTLVSTPFCLVCSLKLCLLKLLKSLWVSLEIFPSFSPKARSYKEQATGLGKARSHCWWNSKGPSLSAWRLSSQNHPQGLESKQYFVGWRDEPKDLRFWHCKDFWPKSNWCQHQQSCWYIVSHLILSNYWVISTLFQFFNFSSHDLKLNCTSKFVLQ